MYPRYVQTWKKAKNTVRQAWKICRDKLNKKCRTKKLKGQTSTIEINVRHLIRKYAERCWTFSKTAKQFLQNDTFCHA